MRTLLTSNNTTEAIMAEYPAGFRRRSPSHPGDVIADALNTLRVSSRHAALAMKVSPMALNNITSHKTGVTPQMALRLGRLFGNGPEIWLRMQQDYDLWHANSAMKAELEGIKPLDADAA
jgi:addiction module HigA family antidote